MIWLADLDGTDDDPYTARQIGRCVITADHVSGIQGDVASPAKLKKQLDNLRSDLDKKFHESEQTRLFNRALVMLLIGIAVTIALSIVTPYVTSLFQEGTGEAVPSNISIAQEAEDYMK